ncbi:MAG: hypothetical protein QGG53_35715 [Planctomycetota bacterium]|jgi:hypothetical protein|nr:hypothetical protein [Planctomycetota bacterium]
MNLYGIAEPNCIYAPDHFVGTRAGFPEIEGDVIEHIFRKHQACGVDSVIWDLGRSFLCYHTDHPMLTPMFSITVEEGLENELDQEGWQADWFPYFQKQCPLRKGLDTAAELGMTLWGRISMNRNYGERNGCALASRFWKENHAVMGEVGKDGTPDPSRLCYFFEEYRAERLAGITEAARITGPRHGRRVEAVVLDFVRQPPMLLYHPAMCEAYQEENSQDPREICADDGETFLQWCRWRADILTAFLRQVRRSLIEIGEEAGQPIQLIPRITDLGFNMNLIEGIDIERWCEEGLIDGIVTSPLNWVRGIWDHDLRPYSVLGRRFGIPVIAGVSLNQQTRFHGIEGSVSAAVLARRVLDYQEQGAEGIALYQSESGLEFDGFDEFIPRLAEPAEVKALLSDDSFLSRWPITHLNSAYGLDCHSWFNNFTIDGASSPI